MSGDIYAVKGYIGELSTKPALNSVQLKFTIPVENRGLGLQLADEGGCVSRN